MDDFAEFLSSNRWTKPTEIQVDVPTLVIKQIAENQ
jgi:hypothetical protein